MSTTENINDLISKFLSGNALPDEAIQLEDWKNESATNQLYFAECQKVFHALKNNSTIREINTEQAWKKVSKQIEPETKIKALNKNNYWRIAASIILVAAITVLINYFTGSVGSEESVYATHNQNKFITLSDSTGINIAKNSKLTVDKDFGIKNRNIKLNGSADFNVVHKDDLPFVVDAGNFYIQDIGTKFSVRLSLDTDSIYVNVDEGVVLLFDKLGSELEIKASEKAIYIRSKKQLINQSQNITDKSQVSFIGSKLNEVIAKLNEQYKTNIVLENSNLANCTITTSFNNESIETILTVITETLGLTFQKTANGYLIKGQKCQS